MCNSEGSQYRESQLVQNTLVGKKKNERKEMPMWQLRGSETAQTWSSHLRGLLNQGRVALKDTESYGSKVFTDVRAMSILLHCAETLIRWN